MSDDSIPRCILLVFLIVFGGVFAATETAFSYCNRIRMKCWADEGNKRAKRVIKILERFDAALTSLLVGINLIYVVASSVATMLATSVWGPAAGSAVATFALTLIIFFFSETIPKNIARTNSDAFALVVSFPLKVLMTLLTPVSFFFSSIGNEIKRIISDEEKQPTMTEDEFQNIIETIEDEGIIEKEESDLICSAIEFGETTANDIMVPIGNVVKINLFSDREEVKELILKEKYSRIPVWSGEESNIVGILQSGECLLMFYRNVPFELSNIIRRPCYTSPETDLQTLMEQMTRAQSHIAVVQTPDGKALGIVTMEDMLEELVGDIYDETDTVEFGTDQAKAVSVND